MALKNTEVAHEWAHQHSDRGGNTGGNFYFSYDTIYSYGSHFPIATHYRNNDEHIILFTAGSYSNTTAKHIHLVSMAIPSSIRCITVANVEGIKSGSDGERDHRLNMAEMAERAFYLIDKQSRARTTDYTDNIQEVQTDFNKYVEYFNCKTIATKLAGKESKGKHFFHRIEEKKYRDTLKDLITGEIRWDNARALSEKELAKAKARKEKAAKDRQVVIDEWRAGQHNRTNKFYSLKKDMLRVGYELQKPNYDGDPVKVIQTSRGLDLDYEQAKRIYYILDRVKQNGEDMEFSDLKVSNWTIDRITKDGNIRAGCHFIPYEESKAIAKAEKW